MDLNEKVIDIITVRARPALPSHRVSRFSKHELDSKSIRSTR